MMMEMLPLTELWLSSLLAVWYFILSDLCIIETGGFLK